MTKKKTRKFLVTTSALVGAISGVAAQATSIPETAAVATTTLSPNQDFLIGPATHGARTMQDSGHQSHSSHASHASHASHVSSSQ